MQLNRNIIWQTHKSGKWTVGQIKDDIYFLCCSGTVHTFNIELPFPLSLTYPHFIGKINNTASCFGWYHNDVIHGKALQRKGQTADAVYKIILDHRPRPVEISAVQSIPVAVGPPCPVGKAFAVQYWLYFILTLVPGIKISIHGFPPQASMTSGRCLYQRNVLELHWFVIVSWKHWFVIVNVNWKVSRCGDF